jgi:CRISPR-associated protein Csx3
MSEIVSSQPLPAVLVGGPPHSGKSVLIYSLSQALRARGVEHYALRACPDGEGDWSSEARPELVKEIRIKGDWTARWVQWISRDIRRRQKPLLVDVGGRPTAEQATMFGLCTHAVLLTPDDAARAGWLALLAEQRLPILADLRSDLAGRDRLDAAAPTIQGVLAGLERHSQAQGPAFEALVDRLAQLFVASGEDLRQRHLASAPAEITVDLDRLARTLGVPLREQKPYWAPEHIPLLLDYLPAATPLAIYRRGVAWVIAGRSGDRLASPARLLTASTCGWGGFRRSALRLGNPPTRPARCASSLERAGRCACVVEGCTAGALHRLRASSIRLSRRQCPPASACC